jgi:hypothetical protein
MIASRFCCAPVACYQQFPIYPMQFRLAHRSRVTSFKRPALASAFNASVGTPALPLISKRCSGFK